MKTTIYILIAIVLSSCASTRAIKHGSPTIDDYKIFEQDKVDNSEKHFTFKELPTNARFLDTLKLNIYFARSDSFRQMTIGESMKYIGKPSAAIIIKNDTILYEHYHGGWNKKSQSTVFSITKTITSLLCSIALKEGYIRSVNDKVTDWYWGRTDHRYFKDKESVRQYYKAFPSMKIATTMRNNKTGNYAAVLHRGGFWAEGLYGQVLYVNTEKKYIAVFLGADRIEDYCYVFDRFYEIL